MFCRRVVWPRSLVIVGSQKPSHVPSGASIPTPFPPQTCAQLLGRRQAFPQGAHGFRSRDPPGALWEYLSSACPNQVPQAGGWSNRNVFLGYGGWKFRVPVSARLESPEAPLLWLSVRVFSCVTFSLSVCTLVSLPLQSMVNLPCFVSFKHTAKCISYAHTFFFRFFSSIGYSMMPSTVPCAMQQVLAVYLFLYSSVYISSHTLISFSPQPLLLSPLI